MHLSQFPQDTQDFIYRLCANAIKRAIKNGTYKEPIPVVKNESDKGGS